VSKGKIWLFKEVVHEDDELAHTSGVAPDGAAQISFSNQRQAREDVTVAIDSHAEASGLADQQGKDTLRFVRCQKL